MEKWYPMFGYEGMYEVSNEGRVRSIDRRDGRGRFHKGKDIKLRIFDDEYRRGVFVRLTRGGRSRSLDLSYLIVNSVPEEERDSIGDIIERLMKG